MTCMIGVVIQVNRNALDDSSGGVIQVNRNVLYDLSD